VNVKKVVAREGLIILGIIFVAICLINMPKMAIPRNAKPEYKNTAQKIQSFTLNPRYEKLEEKNKALLELYKRYLERGYDPDKTSFEWLNKWLDGQGRLFPLEMYNFNAIEKNPINDLGWSLLILGYPIYLLISFIIWAIKTLRKK